MKTSRAFAVGGAAAAILTAGWALTPKDAEATSFSASSSTGAASDQSSSATDGSASDSADASEGDASSSTEASAEASATTESSTSDAAADGAADSNDGTYTGSAVQTRYGVYQVEITVAGGQVTDVALVQEGANDRESQQIKSRSLPQLIQEVLSTQSSDISYISGASYTSDGFARSVADAFDQAGL